MSEWLLTYDGFDPPTEGLREALCTLGNGYMGTRGAAPESSADGVHYPGTYLAGCYDRLASTVAGGTVENEDLVNAPNWLTTAIRIDDSEWFNLSDVDVEEYRKELDMRRGVLTRTVRFRDHADRVTRIVERRFVSMDNPHLAGLETTIQPLGWAGPVEICSALDGRVTNSGVERYRSLRGDHLVPVADGHDDADILWLQVETRGSQVRIAEAARVTVRGGVGDVGRRYRSSEGWVGVDLRVEAREYAPVVVSKVVAIYTSRDRPLYESLRAARQQVARAEPFDRLLGYHVMAWDRLWNRCEIRLDGRPDRALNLYIFHLLQTLSEHIVDLDVGMPARGLHGEAYRGHVFWDELFVFPFMNLHFPEISRALLMYRWRRLPEARWAAQAEGYRGAMYPWQSGSTGRDETQHVHLNPRSGRWLPDNSWLQRHVGIAVAYDIWQYYQATDDRDFLDQYGAEMLLEIARFFSTLATFNRDIDRYEILGVMGPDEYHDAYPDADCPGLNNNAYTNIMVVWVLRRALETLALLPEHRVAELRARLGLRDGELSRWEDITRRMRVVFHSGVISQFEGYDRLRELDWDGLRRRHGDLRRLDRVLEADGDTTIRYQVSKQADVLMLLFLLSRGELAGILRSLGYECDDQCFDRTVDYYLARTSHGSTLSAVVHAWVLSRRDAERAWRFYREALNADIEDVQGGTTSEGIHLGAMAGTIDLVHRCYTGMETRGGELHLDPSLPPEIDALEMVFRYHSHSAQLTCDHTHLRLGLRRSEGLPIHVAVDGQTEDLGSGGLIDITHSESAP